MENYIISIDQSTQGTKALLFNKSGMLMCRTDVPHEQLISTDGWVSHDMEKVYKNVLKAVKKLIQTSGIMPEEITGVGITNQRETSLVWDDSGNALNHAVVWQCTRAKALCNKINAKDAKKIKEITGIPLSPYYPGAKLKWLLENTHKAKILNKEGKLRMGTVDTWLVYKLTGGKSYYTDYSNASRTQLFDIYNLCWSEEICKIFGISANTLPKVCHSNACYGYTDFEGILAKKVPIQSVMGDSHAALYGQGCFVPGMVKTTYGTGSSVMMQLGQRSIAALNGVVTSIAWGMDEKVYYVLEGNIIYSGGVISWLKNDMQLIKSASDTDALAKSANENDKTYMVPAFTGLGAPYWENDVQALVCGMTTATKKAEFVKACLESIAYQINDVLTVMQEESKMKIKELHVDGGATKNKYLMQFQSDISNVKVMVSNAEELSAIGVAYMAGITLGVMDTQVFEQIQYEKYNTIINKEKRETKLAGWKNAIKTVLG